MSNPVWDVKIGDSKSFRIPKTPFHQEKMMLDHRICETLASKLESNNSKIFINSDNISNENLFEKIFNFSYTNLSEITVSRSEYNHLDKICVYFNLDSFKKFVKTEFQRKDFFNRTLGKRSISGYNG